MNKVDTRLTLNTTTRVRQIGPVLWVRDSHCADIAYAVIDEPDFHWGWLLAFEHCVIIARTQKHTDRQRHKANNP